MEATFFKMNLGYRRVVLKAHYRVVEGRERVEGLEQGVHVAGVPLVPETDPRSRLARIVQGEGRGLDFLPLGHRKVRLAGDAGVG